MARAFVIGGQCAGLLLSVFGLKRQGHTVDAIPQARGSGAIGKDMPQMRLTTVAMHLGALHEPA